MSRLSKESPIPHFSKGKLTFSPIYFSICFKGLVGVKNKLEFIIERLFTLKAWRREKKRRKKVEKDQEFVKIAKIVEWNLLGVIPNKVCVIFYAGLIPHTNLIQFGKSMC